MTTANSHLSDQSIEPTIIIKLGELEDREMRVTFNYSYIYFYFLYNSSLTWPKPSI